MRTIFKILINLKDLFNLLSHKTKKKCLLHIILLILVALVEFSYTSSLIPLSESLSQNISSMDNSLITNKNIIQFAFLFGLLALISGFGRSFIIWRNGFIASQLSSEISSAALLNDFKKSTNYFYKYEESQFTSDYSTQLQNLCCFIIRPIFDLFSASCQVLILFFLLFSYAPLLSSTAFICIGISYFICILIAKPRLSKNSKKIKDEVSKTVSLLISIYRLQREIRIFDVIKRNTKNFNSSANSYLNAIASNTFFASFPRFTIETIGTVFLVFYILIFIIIFPQNLDKIIPQISLFILCASKILPSTQQIYASISSISGFKETIFLFNSKSINNTSKSFSAKKINNLENLVDESSLMHLENIRCIIPELKTNLITDFNLKLPSSGLVSIVGKSGCGKSTLLDLLMGIEHPEKGNIFLKRNNEIILNQFEFQQKYFKSFSYVSPSAYVVEGTVKKNILELSQKEISDKLIENARYISCCQDKDGIFLNDDAKKLSMGQKQRVAIARSLVQGRNILVLDEALASIDINNARKILSRLSNNEDPKLIIQISHRSNELEDSKLILKISSERKLITFKNDKDSSAFEKYISHLKN